MNTYNINESMLGENATEADARRMIQLLYDHGHDVGYGNSTGQEEELIGSKDWQECLEILHREKNA